MLYDLVSCPHRVRMDIYGDPADRDEINPFVQMLWEKGSLYETASSAEKGFCALVASSVKNARHCTAVS